MANAYLRAGRTAEAIRLYEKTLKQQERKLGPEHPDTLFSRAGLAGAYESIGRNDEAMPLYEQTLTQMEAILGLTHPDTRACRIALAARYRSTGRTAEAIRLLEQNLKLCEAKFGAEHPETHFARTNLAAAYWSAGKLDRSIPLFEETLRRYKATLGPDHPDTLRTLANLGVNYRDAGQLKEGLTLLEEAFERALKLKPFPKSLAWIAGEMAEAYRRAGQPAKAESVYREELSRARQLHGAKDPQAAAALAVLGKYLLDQQRYAEAESQLRECLRIRTEKMAEHWVRFNTLSMLGGALLGQKKYTEAEPLLLQGYEGMKQRENRIPAGGKIRLTEATERLVGLYEATSQPAKARAWRAKLDVRGKTLEPMKNP